MIKLEKNGALKVKLNTKISILVENDVNVYNFWWIPQRCFNIKTLKRTYDGGVCWLEYYNRKVMETVRELYITLDA